MAGGGDTARPRTRRGGVKGARARGGRTRQATTPSSARTGAGSGPSSAHVAAARSGPGSAFPPPPRRARRPARRRMGARGRALAREGGRAEAEVVSRLRVEARRRWVGSITKCPPLQLLDPLGDVRAVLRRPGPGPPSDALVQLRPGLLAVPLLRHLLPSRCSLPSSDGGLKALEPDETGGGGRRGEKKHPPASPGLLLLPRKTKRPAASPAATLEQTNNQPREGRRLLGSATGLGAWS